MATVTSFTAARMQAIENKTIADADIVDGHLIITTLDGTLFDLGLIEGVAGPAGTGVVFLNSGESSTGIPDGTRICRRY